VLLLGAGISKERFQGMAAAVVVTGVIGWWMASRPLPDLHEVLRLALAFLAAAAVAALLVDRRIEAPLWRLALFGTLWFFAAYAPAYLLYIAPRHGYLPSAGACLLMAAVAWMAARRPVLEGAVLGLVALSATGFYAAGRGEVERWARTAGVIREFERQMRATYPSLPRDTRLVVEGLPNMIDGVPAMPDYALEAALRVWYGHDQILATTRVPSHGPSHGRLVWDHGKLRVSAEPPR